MKSSTDIGVKFNYQSGVDLKTEMLAIKKKGASFIRVEVNWHYSEPKYENYDFTKTLEIIKVAEELNLKIEIAVRMDSPPSWLLIEAGLTSLKISPYSSDQSEMICWENPVILKTAERFLKGLLKQIGKSPAISNWVVLSSKGLWETGMPMADLMFCECKHTLEAFRDWLKSKYKTLNQLNSEYNQNFADWNHILPNACANPIATDWFRFYFSRRKFAQDFFCEIIRKFDKDSRPVTKSNEITTSKTLVKDVFVDLAISKSLSTAANYWIAELPSVTQEGAAYAALALGASKLLFPELPPVNVVNFMKSSDQFIVKSEPEVHDVAILLNLDSIVLANQEALVNFVQKSTHELLSSLVDQGVFPEILFDISDTDLSQFKLIFLPAPLSNSPTQESKLGEFVSNGGTLISESKINPVFLVNILDSASVKNFDLKVIVRSLLSEEYWVVFAFNKENKTSKFALDETQGFELVDSFGCQINTETYKVTIEANSAGCIIFKTSEVKE